MRFALAAVVFSGVLSAASAITLQGRQDSFPSCALPCVTSPESYFGCMSTDNKCLCTNQQYVNETTLCIAGACDAQDTDTAEAISRSLCEQVGVTLTATPTPTPSAAPSGSAPAASNTPPSPSSSSGTSGANTTGSSSSAPSPTHSNAASSSSVNLAFGAAAFVLAASFGL